MILEMLLGHFQIWEAQKARVWPTSQQDGHENTAIRGEHLFQLKLLSALKTPALPRVDVRGEQRQ